MWQTNDYDELTEQSLDILKGNENDVVPVDRWTLRELIRGYREAQELRAKVARFLDALDDILESVPEPRPTELERMHELRWDVFESPAPSLPELEHLRGKPEHRWLFDRARSKRAERKGKR